jgi:hypothetical protein
MNRLAVTCGVRYTATATPTTLAEIALPLVGAESGDGRPACVSQPKSQR